MTLLVYGLSALLVLVGAACILMGVPIIHLEQGWTAVISGTVAICAGCVTFVLGAFLARMDALRLSVEALAGAGWLGTNAGVAQAPPPVVAGRPSIPPQSIATPEPDPDPTIESLERPFARSVTPDIVAPAELALPLDERSEVPAAERPRPLTEPPMPLAERPRLLAERFKPLAERPAPMPESPIPPLEVLAEPAAPELQPNAPVSLDAANRALLSVEPEDARPARKSTFLSSFMARNPPAAARAQEPPVLPMPVEPNMAPLQEAGHESLLPPLPPRSRVDLAAGWPEVPPPQQKPEEFLAALEPEEEPSHPVDQPRNEEPDRADRFFHEDSHMPAISAATPETEEPEPFSDDPAPAIVGRYTAGSASYIMYSNGMIEVQTDTGVHRFDSMQELKSFIEQQDKAPV